MTSVFIINLINIALNTLSLQGCVEQYYLSNLKFIYFNTKSYFVLSSRYVLLIFNLNSELFSEKLV